MKSNVNRLGGKIRGIFNNHKKGFVFTLEMCMVIAIVLGIVVAAGLIFNNKLSSINTSISGQLDDINAQVQSWGGTTP